MKKTFALLSCAALAPTAAMAAQPQPWQLNFQEAATPVMEFITWFENYTLWFIVPIVFLVLALLAYVAVRFRASANPAPSRTSHNTVIEVIWTVAPVVILLFIAIPSFNLLTLQYDPPREPEMTVKATGYQWYWGYEYQPEAEDAETVSFDSYMLREGDRESAGKTDRAAYPRLLAVDNELVIPVDTVVRLLVTGGDVIHSFAMPAFGLKHDAVPGRVNETWFEATAEGLYYGQCSEICGKDHAFMPIAIRVVSADEFNSFLTAAADDLDGAYTQLAATIDAKNKLASASRDEAAQQNVTE